MLSMDALCDPRYVAKLKQAYASTSQLQVSWDASTYDCETLLCITYNMQDDLACYLPIQNLTPVLTGELLPELQDLAAQGKCCRIDTYNTLRALSHALNTINLPLEKFLKGSDYHMGPLMDHEERVELRGIFFVYNKFLNWNAAPALLTVYVNLS